MAGTKRGMPFERTGPFPIDDKFVLSNEEMLAVDDLKMPEKYFAVNTDDGKFYLYDKSATASAETGKFSVLESGGDAEHMELTQAQYNALTPEEKNNGTVYFITDAAANDYHHYTTTERQIGTFYGHSLYERIIDASFTLVPEDDKTVLTNLPSSYTLINVFGVIYERNNPEKRYFVPNSSVSVRYNDPDGDFWTIRFGDCPDNTLIIMRLVYQYIKRTF